MPWYVLDWFMPSTWQQFTWENPWVLYLIALIPVIIILRWVLHYYLKQKLPVAVSSRDIRSSLTNLVRIIPDLLMMLILTLCLVALARPQKTNEKVEQWTEGIDIILVVDISQSMQIEDFQPNRLEAAKNVAIDFINGRFQDRIGLVIFSGDAYSLSPLTTDYDLLRSYITEIPFLNIENSGNKMRDSESVSKVGRLLSDGDNTAGNIDPITAANIASAYGIKMYTIAIGKEGKVPLGTDFFGRPRMVVNTMDETTLREIARIGEGEFFRVSDNQALAQVFELIDEYEKAEIKETRYKDTTDFYRPYVYWAVVLLLLCLLLNSTFISNILQD